MELLGGVISEAANTYFSPSFFCSVQSLTDTVEHSLVRVAENFTLPVFETEIVALTKFMDENGWMSTQAFAWGIETRNSVKTKI